MTTVGEVCDWLAELAPLGLSEPWDNTGLLLGDPSLSVSRVQTCLTMTVESVSEAVDQQAGLVIVHHPLPFKPLKSITTETTSGRLLWKLARSGIAVYSPHTAWDSAESGINSMLAERIGLHEIHPLVPATVDGLQNLGAGRIGLMSHAMFVREIAERLRELFPESRTRGVDSGKPARKIAIACGSGGGLLQAALREGCELFLTGEATFHSCLEAQDAGISMLLIGHFASERFSLVELARRMTRQFPNVHCWPSQREKDPVVAFL